MKVRDDEDTTASIVFVLGAIGSVVVAISIGLVFDPGKDTLEYELWTLAIQALLIGAVGLLLGAAIQENRNKREARARAREAEQERDVMLRDFQRQQLTTALNDLALEYRLIKRSRRMLRLERPVGWQLYRKELGRLEDLQRSLEDSEGTLEVLAAVSSLRLEGAKEGVQGMIRGLDALWKEREGITMRQGEEVFDSTRLTKLELFIESIGEPNSSFQPMKECYKSARRQILAILAELSGAKDRDVATVLAGEVDASVDHQQ